MEIGRSNIIIAYVHLCLISLIVIMQLKAAAQTAAGSYTIKNGRVYIEMSKQADAVQMDKFLVQYNLSDIPLKQSMQTNSWDSLIKLGWKIEKNTRQVFIISKAVMPVKEINSPADKIIFTEKHPTFAEMFPAVNNGLLYGNNRFQNKPLFAVNNSTVSFFLRGYLNASRVMLAGSFNDWSPDALQMTKKENGWVANVSLSPGKYWYKFIVDNRWMFDDDNTVSENDGLGNINSVYFKPNTVFVLDGFPDAKKVFIAGSFNNWHERELQMMKTKSGWQLPLYLSEGTYTYKFIVDGRWYAEEKKQARLPDGHGGYNSVLEIGKPHLFTLKGYSNADHVVLSGNFNGWRTDELFLQKTKDGWQLPYVIGPGNYEYKFIVDGNWITDPSNTLTVDNEEGTKNSYLIVDPNYTFRLKGYAGAKSVFLAGDFNNWSPATLAMKRDGNDWVFSVHLFTGKHLYKFIVDGKWIIDPSNKLWEENEYGTGNSVIWINE